MVAFPRWDQKKQSRAASWFLVPISRNKEKVKKSSPGPGQAIREPEGRAENSLTELKKMTRMPPRNIKNKRQSLHSRAAVFKQDSEKQRSLVWQPLQSYRHQCEKNWSPTTTKRGTVQHNGGNIHTTCNAHHGAGREKLGEEKRTRAR